MLGPIMLTVEDRFEAGVLVVAGLQYERALPEVEPIQYLPRVTIPVLMMNGKYDFFFPVETSQQPFYDLLGTPEENKEWKLVEASHGVGRFEVAKEAGPWLDRYLGPAH